MRAYSKLYVSDAMKNLGGMLDYAVNDCGFAAGEILDLFIISGKADLFGCGDPHLVAGMSGEKLAISVIQESGLTRKIPPSTFRAEKTREYWSGWILAYLQRDTGWPFKWICSPISISYISLHANHYFIKNMKGINETAQSQRELTHSMKLSVESPVLSAWVCP